MECMELPAKSLSSAGPRGSVRPEHDQGKDCRSVRVSPLMRSNSGPEPVSDSCNVDSHATLACYKTLVQSNPNVRCRSFALTDLLRLMLLPSSSSSSTGRGQGELRNSLLLLVSTDAKWVPQPSQDRAQVRFGRRPATASSVGTVTRRLREVHPGCVS